MDSISPSTGLTTFWDGYLSERAVGLEAIKARGYRVLKQGSKRGGLEFSGAWGYNTKASGLLIPRHAALSPPGDGAEKPAPKRPARRAAAKKDEAPAPKTEAKAKPGARAAPKAEDKPEPKAAAKAEPKPEAKAPPKPQPAPKPARRKRREPGKTPWYLRRDTEDA